MPASGIRPAVVQLNFWWTSIIWLLDAFSTCVCYLLLVSNIFALHFAFFQWLRSSLISAFHVISSYFSNSYFRRCRVVDSAFYSLPLPPPVFLCSISALYDVLRISISACGKSALSKMDIPRVTSPPSIHLNNDFHGLNGPNRSSSRIANPFTKAQHSMAIPNSPAEHYVPPPLPPPRYIEEVAAGGDQGIQWRNSFNSASIESGGSVSSRSSLRGNWDQKMAGGVGTGGSDYARRTRLASSLHSQPEADTKYDYFRHVDEGYHSLSGSSLINQSVPKLLSWGCDLPPAAQQHTRCDGASTLSRFTVGPYAPLSLARCFSPIFSWT